MMFYFVKLYDAALNNEDAEIKKLLAAGVSIDEREYSDDFTTVAGKLALQGHLDIALRLIQHFGAGPEYVVEVLLQTDQYAQAQALAAEFDIDIEGAYFQDFYRNNYYYAEFAKKNNDANHNIEIFAHSGDLERVNFYKLELMEKETLNRLSFLYSNVPGNVNILLAIIHHAAHGGHLKLLEGLFAKHEALFQSEILGYELAGPHQDMRFGYNSHRFLNPKLALHALSFIDNDKFRDVLVSAIKQSGSVTYDIDAVNQQAKLIHRAMQEQEIPYKEALTVLTPRVTVGSP